MATTNMKPASADTVRAWAQETGWTDEFNRPPKDRGRIPSALVEAFDRAHKRNRIQYMPGFKDDNGGNAQASRSTAQVATRSSGNATSTAPAPRARRSQESNGSEVPAARVSSQRVSESAAADSGIANIGDAIAMLQSAATAQRGKGTPALITIQTLVNV